MPAGKLNIEIEQGATFSRTIFYKDANGTAINLTGATITGQVRPSYSSSTAVSFALSVVGSAANGEILWTMTAANTATLTPNSPQVYDIDINWGGGVIDRLLYGNVCIHPEVTR